MIIENYTINSLLEYLEMPCQYVHYVHHVTCGYICMYRTVPYRTLSQGRLTASALSIYRALRIYGSIW